LSDNAPWIERLTEIAVILSLFIGGLRLRLPLGHLAWRAAFRLASVVMVASIAGVAVCAWLFLDMDPALALVLVLFDAAYLCKRQSQLTDEARGTMREAHRFSFDAVHQDNSHAREGVVVQFADGLASEFTSGEALSRERRAAILE
jgi:hypothetical protein